MSHSVTISAVAFCLQNTPLQKLTCARREGRQEHPYKMRDWKSTEREFGYDVPFSADHNFDHPDAFDEAALVTTLKRLMVRSNFITLL